MLLPAQIRENSALAILTAPFQVVSAGKPAVDNVVLANCEINGTTAGKAASLGGASGMTLVRDYNPTATLWQKSFVKLAAADDTATFTYTDATPPSNAWMDVWEWANLTATLDGSTTGSTASAVTSLAVPSITTTQANSLIVTHIWWNGAISAPSINAGFTIQLNNSRMCTAFLIAPTAGTYAPTWSWTTSRNAGASMYALKARAGLTPQQASRGFVALMG